MIALEPKIFMFDEPTAGMSVDEVPVVLDLIAQLKQDTREDHPAGRAQDGRGALARRPHHRAAQRQAGRRRQARRRDGLAGGAGGLSRRVRQERPHERAALALGRRDPYRAVSHPARRRPRRAGRPHHDAARPQRRRQDHDVAHHHGPVARLGRRDPPRRRSASRRSARPTSRAPASAMCRRPWRCSPT